MSSCSSDELRGTLLSFVLFHPGCHLMPLDTDNKQCGPICGLQSWNLHLWPSKGESEQPTWCIQWHQSGLLLGRNLCRGLGPGETEAETAACLGSPGPGWGASPVCLCVHVHCTLGQNPPSLCTLSPTQAREHKGGFDAAPSDPASSPCFLFFCLTGKHGLPSLHKSRLHRAKHSLPFCVY